MKYYSLLLIFAFFMVSCGGDDTPDTYPDTSADEDSFVDEDRAIEDLGVYAEDKTAVLQSVTLGNIAVHDDHLFLAATKGLEAVLFTMSNTLEKESEDVRQWGKWTAYQSVVVTDDSQFLTGDWQPDEADVGEGRIDITPQQGDEITASISATGSVTIYGSCALGEDFIVGGRLSGMLEGQESFGGTDAFVARVSATGEIKWATQFGTANFDSLQDVTILGNGNIMAIGNTGSGEFLHGFVAEFTVDGVQERFTPLEESRHLWDITTGEFLAYAVGDTVPDEENDGAVSTIIYFITKAGIVSKYVVTSVGFSSHATGVFFKDDFIYLTGFGLDEEGGDFSLFLTTLSDTGDLISEIFFGSGTPANPKVAVLNNLPVVASTIRDGDESSILITTFTPKEEE